MSVFLVRKWSGTPAETGEMKPEWFDVHNLPLDEMWSGDKYWLPKVLEGIKLKGEFLYGEKDTVLDFNIVSVDNFES